MTEGLNVKEMKKQVKVRYYTENKGLMNFDRESIEIDYVQLWIDGNFVERFTKDDFEAMCSKTGDYNVWGFIEDLGYDLDELAEEIEYEF